MKISDYKVLGKLKEYFCSDLIHGLREKPSIYALRLVSPCNKSTKNRVYYEIISSFSCSIGENSWKLQVKIMNSYLPYYKIFSIPLFEGYTKRIVPEKLN